MSNRDRRLERPEHAPDGYEWLPDAYLRDIEPGGEKAVEKARRALAEGHVPALLRTSKGERHSIATRMWDKEPVREIVIPYFTDGWMRMNTKPYTQDGSYAKGWVFVPAGAFASRPHQTKPGEPSYISPDIMFAQKVILAMKIDGTKRVLKKNIENWIRENWDPNLGEMSDRRVSELARFVRRPEDRQGGNV